MRSANVIFIGDMHLKASSPSSRIDDFPRVILNKIKSIAEMNLGEVFILLGDVFDSPITPISYLAEVIETFRELKNKGIRVYTIAGNHDIKYNRMESLSQTALGILLATGLVMLAHRVMEYGNTRFAFFHYPEEVTPKESSKYEVCVAHRYFEFGLAQDSFTREDLRRLNYDAMVLGHYHAPCNTEKIHNTILYRPGSLSRNTLEPYNKTRTPRVLVFDANSHEAEYYDVPCARACDVFLQQSNNVNPVMDINELIRFITTSYNTADMDVREYFSKLKIPYDCKFKISKYLDEAGI